MFRFVFFFLLQIALFATDFDCIVIGSSPFSLFEALYQSHLGNRVLILEESSECGGAWKGIDVCGIPHADLGCHQIGSDMRLKSFLEVYAGCKIVSMDHPDLPFESAKSPNGWYFSRGCYELIENLLKLMNATNIALLTNTRAENAFINSVLKTATIQTKEKSYTTNKLIITSTTKLNIQPSVKSYGTSKHYHLYLLIEDPTPPKFTYHNGIVNGSSRMMNLTHFMGLVGSGKQLIVLQTHSEEYLANERAFLDGLKNAQLIDPSACILRSETYIYESGAFHQGTITSVGAQGIVEMIQTGHFQTLSSHIPKWESVLKPFCQALPLETFEQIGNNAAE